MLSTDHQLRRQFDLCFIERLLRHYLETTEKEIWSVLTDSSRDEMPQEEKTIWLSWLKCSLLSHHAGGGLYLEQILSHLLRL